MSFESGQHFGPYTIADTIGAGGMGEVWRATDTNLKREVAIKVLPASFADDAERLARFQREAEVLASLNHPNIAQIYGLEKSDGKTALVMELVEGPTLAERIMQGPIPVDEALPIARQIIDALEAAHAKGIVHRDLKPANVKLTPDGTVKVLDFGIAKALELPTGSTGPGLAQLTSPAMTEAGLVLGTAAYMSPEQARGRPVDQRSDIWALGCVMYEMLTGQPTFGGEDRTSTLARVLEREVQLKTLPDSIPWAVRQTIAHCLEKDVKRRWHHVGDVRQALDGILYAYAEGGAAESSRPGRRWLPAAAAALLAVIVTAIAINAFEPAAPAAAPTTRFIVETPDGLPVVQYGPLALSPDGRRLAFVSGFADSDRRIYLKSFDSFDAEPIDGSAGALLVFYAPDGSRIGFQSRVTGQIMSLGLDGGSPIQLAASSDFVGASWSNDGTLVFGASWGEPLSIVRNGTAAPAALTTLDADAGEQAHLWPDVLPDGRHVLFTIWSGQPSWDDAKLAVADLETGEHTLLLDSGTHGRYVDTGHIVFWRADALWAVAFDLGSLSVTSEAKRLVPDVRMNIGNGNANFAVSANGTLAYVPGKATILREAFIVDRAGATVRRLDTELPIGDPAFSPDGTRVAVTMYRGGTFGVGVFYLDRNTLLDQIFIRGDALEPSWIDNDRLSFQSNFEDNYRDYTMRADGSADPVALPNATQGFKFDASEWTADGRSYIYTNAASGTRGIWIIEPDGDGQPGQLIDSPANNESNPVISPRGDWIAYVSDESGNAGIYLRPFPDVNARRLTITGDGLGPAWAGDSLFYITREGIVETAMRFDDNGNITPGAPELVIAMSSIRKFSVSPDGLSFAIERDALESATTQIYVVENWAEELQRAFTSD